MAERFLSVDVSKLMFSTLFIRVDDEDPRFSDLFDAEGKLALRPGSPEAFRDAIQAGVRETISHDEWEGQWNPEYEVEGYKVVPKEEAIEYPVFDGVSGKVYESNSNECEDSNIGVQTCSP